MTATPGRWLATAIVAAAASFAGLEVARAWAPAIPPADLARYPDVAEADPNFVRICWSALGHGRTAIPFVRPSEPNDFELRPRTDEELREAEREEALFRAFRDAPAPATRALLRVLCVFRFQPQIEVSADSGGDDAPRTWLAAQLREHAGDADVRILGRIATDETVAPQARRVAIDAIARPDDPVAAEVLEDIALDRSVRLDIRRYAVERFPRLHAPLSPRVRDLLDQPFGRMDETAAVALLRSGDAEAPSLVVDALRSVAREWDGTWADGICAALRTLVEGDAETDSRLAEVKTPLDAERAANAMHAWMESHPERLDTDFERARRESRVRAPPEVSLDVVAASGTSFDLGAALLRTDGLPGRPELELERLDRLARAVRRDAGPDPTPQRWIDAMNERLVRSGMAPEWPVLDSELRYVLRTGYGNCMGRSSLYLAVAERLGLPIHGVPTPSHVFVRWDDGTFRRNIECTESGVERTDASYDGREGLALASADVASGAYLQNLQKRQFLAVALVNRAARFRQENDLVAAARAYDDSLRLDPRCPDALVCRARLRACSPLVEMRSAGAADARAALSIRSLVPGEADLAADALFADGAPEEVLHLADAVASAYPKSAVAAALRAKALFRLGRRDEACETVREALGRAADDYWARLSCAQLLAVAGDPAWRRAFALGLRPQHAFYAQLELTKRLLDGSPWHSPVPEVASESLDLAEASLTAAKQRHDWAVMEMQHRVADLRRRCRLALQDAAGSAESRGDER